MLESTERNLALMEEWQRVSHQEIWLSSVAAFVALLFVALASYFVLAGYGVPYLFASMGASAVLIFAVPSSTMNRPWVVFCSHIVAAIIGTTCALYIGNQFLAIAVAIAAIIAAMHYLKCMHPPGGATALLIVLASDEVHALGYQIVLTPVALNTLLLVFVAVLIGKITAMLESKKHLTSSIDSLLEDEKVLTATTPFSEQDLMVAMGKMDTYIDVQRADLLKLYEHALHHQRQRSLGSLRCVDLMLPDLPSAEFGTELIDVWGWFKEHEVTGIPVVDRGRHVIGIVTLKDFIDHANAFPQVELAQRIDALIRPTNALTSEKPEVAGQIMSSPAITALDTSLVADLLALLDSKKIRHIPIVNAEKKLVGVLSREHIVSALEQLQTC